MINLTFVLRFPKPRGRYYGNQLDLGAIRTHCHKQPLLFTPAFDKAFDNSEASSNILNGNNSVTSCTKLDSFHLIISEFTLFEREFLLRLGRNLMIALYSAF